VAERRGAGLQNRKRGFDPRRGLRSRRAPKVSVAARLTASQKGRVRFPLGALTQHRCPSGQDLAFQARDAGSTPARCSNRMVVVSVPTPKWLAGATADNVPAKRNRRRAGSVDRRTGFESPRGPYLDGNPQRVPKPSRALAAAGEARLRQRGLCREGGHSFPAEAHNLSLTAGATRPPATAPQA
jgi:hypothetical protein